MKYFSVVLGLAVLTRISGGNSSAKESPRNEPSPVSIATQSQNFDTVPDFSEGEPEEGSPESLAGLNENSLVQLHSYSASSDKETLKKAIGIRVKRLSNQEIINLLNYADMNRYRPEFEIIAKSVGRRMPEIIKIFREHGCYSEDYILDLLNLSRK